jgi:hypothetical protein
MAKRTGNSSVNSSIRQQTNANNEGLNKLLEAQQASLGELTSIKKLMELSKDVDMAKTTTSAAAEPDTDKIAAKMLDIAKEQLKGSRAYWKTQEEFQVEWDKEAKNIAEMAKGMKTFKTLSEKMADKKEGLKEKFSLAGMKKNVLGALNVGGVFNKTLEKDKFIEQQKALGAAPMKDVSGKVVESAKDFKKRLSNDFEGAHAAAKETKKTEQQIDKMKVAAANGGQEISEEHLKEVNPEFAKLLDKRQANADEFGKYQRATDIHSPTPVNRNLVQSLNPAPMSNVMPIPATPGLGKTPTATAAEATQVAEIAEEGKKMEEDQTHLLKVIAENTGGDHKAQTKPAEEKKPEGGGLLGSIMSFLGTALMTAFRALFNPMTILKALSKVFAIGMIIGALFEGIMDGFEEYQKSGDIGKAIIAAFAGIIDFITFGLFDKEEIKDVLGSFSKWISDHLVKPFTKFIDNVKNSFMGLLEKIGIPKIVLANKTKLTPEIAVGPYYPFKSDSQPTTPEAPVPMSGNQVSLQSANNAGAAAAPSTSTNVVNAPVSNTSNNNSTQVIKSPIRNTESSQSKYLAAKYA